MRKRSSSHREPPLAGRVVAVTGGARGIGRAIATAMSHRGCRVAIGDIDATEAERTAAASLGPEGIGLALDVGSRDSFEAFLAQVEERLGPVDVLVNNAGVMVLGDFEREEDAIADRMIEVNLRGVMIGTKLALGRMRPRSDGHVVNIASLAGKAGFPGAATYSATKHGVVGLCEAVRAELHGSGVAISCVMPTVVETQLGSGLRKTRGLPTLEPDDVAEAVVEAVSSRRFEVSVPRYARGMIAVSRLLPRRFNDFMSRVVGTDQVLAGADSSARAEYERSVTRGSGVEEDVGS